MNKNKSLDQIHYETCIIGDACADDEANTGIIVRTLAKLPPEVRDKVLEEVAFVHTLAQGTVAPTEIAEGKRAFVILNFRGIRSERAKADVVAHELAHYILTDEFGIGGADAERAADDLCEKWGFRRGYKDYKKFGPGRKP